MQSINNMKVASDFNHKLKRLSCYFTNFLNFRLKYWFIQKLLMAMKE